MSDTGLNNQIEKLLLKVYNEYVPQDWQLDTGDLNPKREVEWDESVTKRVVDRIQEITNKIVRQRLIPAEDPQYPAAPIGGDSIPAGVPLLKRAKLDNVGGGDSVFGFLGGDGHGDLESEVPDNYSPVISADELDFIIGTMPPTEAINNLDLPLQIDCDTILNIYFGESQDDDDDDSDDSGSGAGRGDGKNDSGDGAGDGDDSGDAVASSDCDVCGLSPCVCDNSSTDDGNDNNCALIEINWLKILLIIAKALQKVSKVIDFVMSIIMPIIAIVQLAVGAWLNPANIGKIAQIVIQMVLAMAVTIVAMIIQMIWDLLNLDCLAAGVESMIEEIRKALSAFSSMASAFNPNAVALLLDSVSKDILDPLADAAEQLKQNMDGWADMVKDFGAYSPKDLFEQYGNMEAVKGLAMGAVPAAARVGSIAADIQRTFMEPGGPLSDARKMLTSMYGSGSGDSISSAAGGVASSASQLGSNVVGVGQTDIAQGNAVRTAAEKTGQAVARGAKAAGSFILSAMRGEGSFVLTISRGSGG